jgi:hypothetical protein
MKMAEILPLQRGRLSKRAMRMHKIPKRRKPLVTRQQFKKAIVGTDGIINAIAGNLGIHRNLVAKYLRREGWDDVRRAYAAECDVAVDRAEQCIHEVIQLRGENVGVAVQTAKWLLTRRRPDLYGDKNTTVIEGGNKPQRHVHLTVDAGVLNAPPENKRAVLALLDAKEAELEAQIEVAGVGKLPAPPPPNRSV